MTSAVAVDRVRILLDKYSTPYFTDDEVLTFLNMSQFEFLHRLVPDATGGVANFEADELILKSVLPLVYEIQAGLPASDGQGNTFIPFSTLNTLLSGQIADSTVYAIISLASVESFNPYSGTPIKFTRHNDLFANYANYFKKPTVQQPRYTVSVSGVKITPTPSSAVYKATVLKNPKALTIGNSPEWADQEMNQIIEIAAQYGATSTRDQEFQQVNTSTTISK
jgi:hypothetical protein